MCGGSKSPPPLPETPKREDPEVQAAIEKERELALKRRGRRSTILTSPLQSQYPEGKPTLLGQ